MNMGMGGIPVDRIRTGKIAVLGVLFLIYMGSGAPAWALQVLEASDHAELVAEISDTDVNRIALDGDRVSRVIQSPGGFTVEHDPVRGDLYLHPDRGALRAANGLRAANDSREPAPGTLYLGTEQGFTYRLSLSAVSRDSAQILIRNAAIAAVSVARSKPVDGERRGELVSLIMAVARGEPVPGYAIAQGPETVMGAGQDSLVELWQGPRFIAHVLRTPAGGVEDAEQLARLSGANVVAAWMSAPGREGDGERIAVFVEPIRPAVSAR